MRSISRRRGWHRAAGVLLAAAVLGGGSLAVVHAAGRRSGDPAVSAASLRAPTTRHSAYPASFVGSAMTGGSQGLQVFASGSGRMLSSLTRDKDAFAPQVLERARRIYYLADGRGDNCTNILRVPSGGGRPTMVRRLVKATAAAFAVSQNARLLAYVWSSQAHDAPGFMCDATSPSFLTVVNLVTGQRHTMTGVPGGVSELSWSPDDRHLVVDLTDAADRSEAELVARPLSAATFRRAAPLPCPDRARSCAEFTPQYDRSGQIFFVACLQSAVATCRYVLARSTGRRITSLASTTDVARYQAGGWSAVDWAGSSALFTVPVGRGWATFRWTDGHVAGLSRRAVQLSW